MTDRPAFEWNGAQLRTAGDVFDMLMRIHRDAPHDGPAFMDAYREFNPTADADVGYLIGYLGGSCDGPERAAVMATFGVSHPTLGAAAVS